MEVLQRASVIDGGYESSVLLEDDILRAALETQSSDGQRVEQGHVGGKVPVQRFLDIVTKGNVIDDGQEDG